MLADAIAQIPAPHRRHLLIRDSAASTNVVLDWLTAQNASRHRVECSLDWSISESERAAIRVLPALSGMPALAAGDGVRDSAEVAELHGLLTVPGWPERMRVIVRRERPHSGAQLSLFEERDGWRYTAFVTNTAVALCSGWKPGTARPGRWTGSAAPKTPACAGFRRASSR